MIEAPASIRSEAQSQTNKIRGNKIFSRKAAKSAKEEEGLFRRGLFSREGAKTRSFFVAFWLPRSSVGARADAPASRGRTRRRSGQDCIPTRSVGTRGNKNRKKISTFTDHHLLFTVNRKLLTVHRQLSTVNRQLLTVNRKP